MLRRTKFYRPSTPQDLVLRPRLIDKLSQGLSRPLTLISAPAGYGKTMLASSFLETCSLPSAWLSLDEGDDDLRVFLDYFLTALDSVFPGSLRHTQLYLAGTTLPPVPIIADSLINELAELERAFILVLDDLQLIRSADVFRFFAALLRHPVQGMHLLFLTRQDPPMGLGTLRARDQVSEIRSRDLRFTASEVAAFMAHVVVTPMHDETLALLTQLTEGWAAALRLAALTLRYGGEIDPQAAELYAENRYVTGYLVSEIFSRLPPEVEDFLVKTSILDTLCAPLCNAVVDPNGDARRGQAYLEMLEETNSFTVALDAQGLWYRYHHLFRSILRSRLTRKHNAEEIDALHIRASAWYASHDSLEQALEHALAGNDMPGAVQVVAQHRHRVLNSEQRPRLQHWLSIFPERAIAQFPDLLLAKAWSIPPGRANSGTVLAQVDQAQALIDPIAGESARARELQGEIDTLRCIAKGFAANDPQGVIALATSALAVMPKEWYMARAAAWLHLALAYQISGQLEHAYRVLAMGQPEDMAGTDSPRTRIAGSRGLIDWMAADLPNLVQTGATMVSVSQAANMYESLGWGHYFLATACYQRNDLAAAALHANVVQEQRYACDPVAVAQSAFIVAAIHQARGMPEEARLILDRTNAFLVETHSMALLSLVQAFGAELAARQGDVDAAGRWAASAGSLTPLGAMGFFYAPQLTLPKVLLAMNARAQAAAALAHVHAFVTATHNTRFLIDILALQALLYHADGDEVAALQALGQALSLAQPGGLIRVFVDLGTVMASLLERLARRSSAPGYIQQILRAFPSAPASSSWPFPSLQQPARSVDLVEPLTSREFEVLALLAQRLSAREIAQRLVISTGTVKRHTANIYQKLAVNDRNAAVAAAIALGILPAPR